MSSAPLASKKVAVLLESEYIPYEIRAYREQFAALGAKVPPSPGSGASPSRPS